MISAVVQFNHNRVPSASLRWALMVALLFVMTTAEVMRLTRATSEVANSDPLARASAEPM